MSTHERVIRGMLADALDDGRIYDQQVDGIIAYIESVTEQTPPRPDTETHKPLSLADQNPSEQPQRREVWAVWRDDGQFYGSFTMEGNAGFTANRINGTYSLMREVLPGDPSPEVVADVVADLSILRHSVEHIPDDTLKSELKRIAAKLEGK